MCLLVKQADFFHLFSSELTLKAQGMSSGQSEMEEKEYHITFNQIYLSKPTITEADGETSVLFPMAARLRNLT